MVEGDEDGGDRSLVPLGQLLRKVLQEFVFVLDLFSADWSAWWVKRRWISQAYNDVGPNLRRNDRVFVYPIFRRKVGFPIGEDFRVKLTLLLPKLLLLQGPISRRYNCAISRSTSVNVISH